MDKLSFMFRLAAVCFILATTPAPASANPLILKPEGSPRQLQGPIFGGSTTAFYEHLLDDPAKIATLKTMHIGLDRFSGGSDANFYNWRTGLIEVPTHFNSSPYVRFWANAAANIARGLPGGVTMEQYQAFSRQIGAEVIMVPNLESSSVAEQAEWFKHLAAEGAVPQRIELGNEFWIAMGFDPASMARWPDEPSSMRVMKQYLDAIRPYLPANAKMAVQAAASEFIVPDNARGWRAQRLRQWDEDLRPEPWFDAVTLHLYPRLSEVMGDPRAASTPPAPGNAMARLKAMMAHVDEGVERELRDIERRLPGKQIWITEWNARGGNPVPKRGDIEPASPAMAMLWTTRMAMVYLRHPSVTASLYFMFSFRPRDNFATFVSDWRGNYAPVPLAVALAWLNEAANAGGSFQRVIQPGARPIAGGGARDESYLPVEGGLFQSRERATLILENASADQFSLDPATLRPGRRPSSVEFMSMPDLADTAKLPARIESRNAGGTITVAPFSVTRIVWDGRASGGGAAIYRRAAMTTVRLLGSVPADEVLASLESAIDEVLDCPHVRARMLGDLRDGERT